MKSNWIKSLFKAFLLAEGICALSITLMRSFDVSVSERLIDVLFFEGAVLFAVSGLIDVGRSVTFSNLRDLCSSNIPDSPPQVKKPGYVYILLIAGLLLFAQALLMG